jgi:hypothetical protein
VAAVQRQAQERLLVDPPVPADVLTDVLMDGVRARQQHDQAPLGLDGDQLLGRLEVDRFQRSVRTPETPVAGAADLELQAGFRRIRIHLEQDVRMSG